MHLATPGTDDGWKIIISCQRHYKPIYHAPKPIMPLEGGEHYSEIEEETGRKSLGSTFMGSMYAALHPTRATYLRRLIAQAQEARANHSNEGLGLTQDYIMTRQAEAYATPVAEAWQKITGDHMPDVAVSSPYGRTIVTRDLMLGAWADPDIHQQHYADNTPRIVAFESEMLGPASACKAGGNQPQLANVNVTPADITGKAYLELIATDKKIQDAFERAKQRVEEKKSRGEAITEKDKTFHVYFSGHDSAPFNLINACLGPERTKSEHARFSYDFVGVAPYGGMACVEINGITDLKQLNRFRTDDGIEVLDLPPENIKFLGSIQPRQLMADRVRKLAAVIEKCTPDAEKGKIPVPSQCPLAEWTPQLINQICHDLMTVADMLPNPDKLILKQLYPKTFANNGEGKAQRQAALDTLRNIDLGLNLVMAASQRRGGLNVLAQRALDAIGPHEKVVEEAQTVGKFTEVRLAETLWKRHALEIDMTKPSIQPPDPNAPSKGWSR